MVVTTRTDWHRDRVAMANDLRPLPASGRRALCLGLQGLLSLAVLMGCGDGTSTTGGGLTAGSLTTEAERGQRIALESGCVACHGSAWQGGAGPALVGLAGATVTLDDGTTVVADRDYLVRAVVDPTAEQSGSFAMKMPPNQLSDQEVADVVAFIEAIGTAAG